MERRWTRWVLISILIFLISIMSINILVDPYQFFHKHSKGFFWKNSRYQNLGLINSYLNDEKDKYDSIIIGSSLSNNFNVNEVEKFLMWGKVLKLSANGAMGKTQNIIINKAIRTGNIENILWEIFPYFYVSDNPNIMAQHRSMPIDLYEDSFVGYLKYLLSSDAFLLSYNLLYDNKLARGLHGDLNTLYEMTAKNEINKSKKFNSEINYKKIKKILLERKKIIMPISRSFVSIDENVVSVIKKNKDINFYLFIPPASRYYYANFKNIKRYDYIALQEYLVRITSQYKNVKVFLFDNEEFTKDLHNYRDPYHYISKINKEMLMKMGSEQSLVNTKTLKAYLDKKLKNINDYKLD